MRLIPCRSDKCNGRPAMLPPSKEHPEGEPYIAGRYLQRVRCARCKQTTKLSAGDFARLPTLTVGDFEDLAKEHHAPGLARRATQDLEGAGFTNEQAKDLYGAGFRGAEELASMERER